MRPNCRSRGVATEDAMISGLAPGNCADTEMVGKSICGRGDTGRKLKATAPARAIATVSKVVATGRRMNGEDRLIASRRREPPPCLPGWRAIQEISEPDGRRRYK